MALNIICFILGRLIIKVKGFSYPRLMNMLSSRGIYIWNIRETRSGITLSLCRKDFKIFRDLCRKSGCVYEICERRGLPYILLKIKGRYIFVAGGIFFGVFLMTVTRFIWLIDVEGNYRIPTGDILNLCRELNLDYGTYKGNINKAEIEEEIKNSFEELSFAAITISGTRALITVSETIPQRAKFLDTAPADIVASEDALITSVTVRSGRPVVREGISVKKGDILINADVEIKAEQEVLGTKPVRSEGEIYGKTVDSYSFTVPYNRKKKIYLDKSFFKYDIEVFDKKFSLNYNKNDTFSEKYDKIESKKQLRLINDIYLPFIIDKTEYKPYRLTEEKLDKAEAEREAERIVTAKIINTYPKDADILGKEFDFRETEEGLSVCVDITVIKQVGIFKAYERIKADGETKDRSREQGYS